MRENEKALRKAGRDLERERLNLEKEEKKIVSSKFLSNILIYK